MRAREIERRIKRAGKIPSELTNEFYRLLERRLEKLSVEELLAVINSGEADHSTPKGIVRSKARWMLSLRGRQSVYGRSKWQTKSYPKLPIGGGK